MSGRQHTQLPVDGTDQPGNSSFTCTGIALEYHVQGAKILGRHADGRHGLIDLHRGNDIVDFFLHRSQTCHGHKLLQVLLVTPGGFFRQRNVFRFDG